MTEKKKLGAPRFPYTDKLGDEICDAISSSSKGIDVLCKENPHWPSNRIVYKWRNTIPDFGQKYARSKALQCENLLEEINNLYDQVERFADDKGNMKPDNVSLGIQREKANNIKWLASKLLPKKYGDHKNIEVEQNITLSKPIIPGVTSDADAVKIYQEFCRSSQVE